MKMSKNEEGFEELITHIPKEIREEHLHEILKNSTSLRDAPIEIRKREANQAIYLLRYE